MKKTSFRTIMSLILCLAIVLSVGGCGKKVNQVTDEVKETQETGGKADSESTSVSKKVIKPSFFLTCDTAYTGDEIVWKTIKNHTNIDFQVIPVPLASYKEKMATTIASGDLPDVMGLRSYDTVDEYGPQGAFLSFDKYIEDGKMPNFVKVLENIPPAMLLATSPNGKRYSAPRIYETPRMDEAFLCRVDIFEKNNITREPKDLDEFYQVLKKLKELYPDSTPYLSRWGTEHMLSGFSHITNTNYGIFLNPETDQYEFGGDSQAFKDTIAFIAKLYKEGLMDKDFATLSDEEYHEKLISNKAFVAFDYQATGFYESSKELADEGWWWGAMLPPEYNGKKRGYPVLQGYFGYVKSISSKTKYKEELINFIDWTYSEEGKQALMFGIEGEDYAKKSDNTIDMKSDILYAGNPQGKVVNHGLNDQNIFSVLPGNAAEFYENVGKFTIAQKKYLNENNAFGEPLFYARFVDKKEKKEYNGIRNQLKTYMEEAATKVVIGEESIENWDNIIDTAKKSFNVDHALELVNNAYKQTYNK